MPGSDGETGIDDSGDVDGAGQWGVAGDDTGAVAEFADVGRPAATLAASDGSKWRGTTVTKTRDGDTAAISGRTASTFVPTGDWASVATATTGSAGIAGEGDGTAAGTGASGAVVTRNPVVLISPPRKLCTQCPAVRTICGATTVPVQAVYSGGPPCLTNEGALWLMKASEGSDAIEVGAPLTIEVCAVLAPAEPAATSAPSKRVSASAAPHLEHLLTPPIGLILSRIHPVV